MLNHARWDDEAGGLVCNTNASAESPSIEIPGGFDQAIVSWNSFTPPGSHLTVHAQARIGDTWTRWYDLGLWNTDGRPRPRTSVNGQEDEHGNVLTDTLVLKALADAIRVRVELSSVDGQAFPVLRRIAVNTIDSSVEHADPPPVREAWGTDLDVPELSQLSVPDGAGWCSPTSIAMVLGYWAKKLNRPDLEVGIEEAARATHDEAWGGTGNWVFNTAYAGEFRGMRAFVSRLQGIADIERWVSDGAPVIVSVNYPIINPANPTSHGHLMLVRGFTSGGDPIFNDPWTRFELGETVRRVYPRQALYDSWLGPRGTHGTVYLITAD